MKTELIAAPNKKNPITVVIRLIPEDSKDDKLIKQMEVLRGMNVLMTNPIVDKKTCVSLMFTQHSKRAGTK